MATEKEVDDFIVENRQWINEEAESVFRNMGRDDQRSVIAEGSMSNVRDPVAIIKSRAWRGGLKAHRSWYEQRQSLPPKELLREFLEANAAWLNDEAEDLLASLEPIQLKGVAELGNLQGVKDPIAIIKTRLKWIKEAEAKGGKKGKGKGKGGKGGKANAGGSRDQERISNPTPEQKARWVLPLTVVGPGKEGGEHVDTDAEKAAKEEENSRRRDEVKERNLRSMVEGRCVQCTGIPSIWSTSRVEEFFAHQGEVQSVHLVPVKSSQESTRTVLVNYMTPEGAKEAINIIDKLELEDNGVTVRLSCSKKWPYPERDPVKRAMGLGLYDSMKAREEGRTAYITRIPSQVTEQDLQELASHYGACEQVKILDHKGPTQAAFINMASPGEVAYLIQCLNNANVWGGNIGADFPKEVVKRRRKPEPEEEGVDWFVAEFRNFPHWTTEDDLKATVKATGQLVRRCRVACINANPMLSIAKCYFEEPHQMQAAVIALRGYEFSPGYQLMVEPLPSTLTGTITPIPDVLPDQLMLQDAKPTPVADLQVAVKGQASSSRTFTLELRNFPDWTEQEDITATIEEVGFMPLSVSIQSGSGARPSWASVAFADASSQQAAAEKLQGFEITPGYALQVQSSSASSASTPSFLSKVKLEAPVAEPPSEVLWETGDLALQTWRATEEPTDPEPTWSQDWPPSQNAHSWQTAGSAKGSGPSSGKGSHSQAWDSSSWDGSWDSGSWDSSWANGWSEGWDANAAAAFAMALAAMLPTFQSKGKSPKGSWKGKGK